MKKRISFIFLSLLIANIVLGQKQTEQKSTSFGASKNTAGLSWQVLNINNLWTWHRSDGEGNHSPFGESGLAYPVFTAHCIYEDNLVFGGIMYVNNWPENGGTKAALQPIRVNGGAYTPSRHGLTQGWVDGSGATANYMNSTNDPRARIYRIRRDYSEMTDAELMRDASIFYGQASANAATYGMIDAVRSQYEKDWQEWPVQYGAPFIDRNGNGVYDPPPLFQPWDRSFTADSLIAGNYDEPGIAPRPLTPPADQVLFTVYHDLDRTKTLFFAGSEPIGLEIQKTVWGYKPNTELPEQYFVRYRFINKGGVDIGGGIKGSFYIDSLFIGQWIDPDIGNVYDDLSACDTLLHLAYAYNKNAIDNSYQQFSLPPPSAGYTILGGPLVPAPTDSGLFGFSRVYGKKNLRMTSFAPEQSGDNYSIPAGNYNISTGRWWFMLRGFAPVGTIADTPQPYNFPPGYPITPFPYSGDPVTGTGFLHGLGLASSPVAGDVRLFASSGPSKLAPGDTVELTVAIAVGLGADRLSSISVMKRNIAAAREAYNALFDLARAPEKPALQGTALNREIILDWGNDAGKIKRTETNVIAQTYEFEGYNVYQLPSRSSSLSDGVKVATSDIKNGITSIKSNVYDLSTLLDNIVIVQRGTDSGIKHFISLKSDYLNDVQLYNGREYFFGLTAYNYTGDTNKKLRAYESEPSIVSIIPQIPFGVQIDTRTGDSLKVSRVSGAGEGSITAIVYNPLKTTGHLYEVRFDTLGAKLMIVRDASVGMDVYSGGLPGEGESLIAHVDGVQITLIDQPSDFRNFLVTSNALGSLSPPEMGAFAFDSSGFPPFYFDAYSSTDRPNGARQQSVGLTVSQGWGIHVGGVSTDLFYTTFKKVISNNDSTWGRIIGHDFELRFTGAAQQARSSTTESMMTVTFELWNTGADAASAADDYRMIPVVFDGNGNGVFDYDGTDHSISSLDDDPETDWISWYDPVDRSPGQGGYNAWVLSGGTSGLGELVMANMVLVLWNGGSVSDPSFPLNVSMPLPETGTVFRIITQKPFGANDLFTFATLALRSNSTIVKSSARHVGVYPNPYVAGWNYEGELEQRMYVTFNNLPLHAKIRIFNLAGHLVRTLENNDASQFMRWDLTNEHNWQVGSGIYICHVEMPDIGETKILKLALVLSAAPPTY